MTDLEREICQKRAYYFTPPGTLAREFGVDVATIKKVLSDNDAYLRELASERTDIWKGKYRKLIKLSQAALLDILKADHLVREYKGGEVVKESVNAELLKMKREVAERVLEENEVIKPKKSGGGIFIDNRRQSVISDREKVLEIEERLNDCKIEIPNLSGDN